MASPRIRYDSLDAWRAIAALWVVFHHVHATLVDKAHLTPLPVLSTLATYGWLGVPIFFVISGFCIAASASGKEPKAFAIARLRRIFPPYLAIFPVYVAMNVVGSMLVARGVVAQGNTTYYGLHGTPIGFWLVNALLLNGFTSSPYVVGVAWSLAYEIWFYCVIGLLLVVGLNRPNLLAVLHVLTIGALIALSAGVKLLFPFDLWAEFGLGCLMYDLLTSEAPRKAALQGVSVVAFALTCLWAFRNQGVAQENSHSWLSWAVAAVVFPTLIACYRYDRQIMASKVGAWLGDIGKFSYSLYLVHFALVIPMGFVAMKLHLAYALGWLMVVVSVVISVLGGKLFYLLVEKRTIPPAKPAAPAIVDP